LLADLNIPLRVLRKHVYWFAAPNGVYDARVSNFPTFLFELPHGVFYGFPDTGEGSLKVAEHSGGAEVADPLADSRDDDLIVRERVADFVRRYLPLADAERVTAFSRCFYTMSPDEQFIVDRHPLHPQVVFAAGLSGHGFKFAPVLGEILADLALRGVTSLPAAFLGTARFRHRN
jgi:glycine/D-amino acid oxidase-like deaminating enzyme